MLADAAHAVGGKLYILGGGWSNIWATAPFAIACKVEVPWHLATDTHKFRLELVDADGQAVEMPTPDGSTSPVVVEGEVSTGIAPGVKPGTPMDAVIAIGLPPIELELGRYQFRVSIDGQSNDEWSLAFNRVNPPANALAA
jgi:hypothetical protein